MVPANDNNQAKRTIKLKPLTPDAREDNLGDGIEDTISMSRADLEENPTIEISKSEVTGAKATIKLRPSNLENNTQTAEISPSKQTIKLQPKNNKEKILDDITTPLAKQTIKLVPKPSVSNDETVSVAQPSAATIKLGSNNTEAAKKKTLQIKKPVAPSISEGSSSLANNDSKSTTNDYSREEEDTADEPGAVFTIITVVTFAAMLYLSFVVFAQYWNDWEDETKSPMNVPFLTGNVK